MTYPIAAAGSTPAYGIKYPAPGAPLKYTRAILEDVAKTIEAALIQGGIAPPTAVDLAAAVARIGTLEKMNDPVTDLVLAANVISLTASYRKAGVYRVGRACCLTSVIQITPAVVAAGATVMTAPVGFRPPAIIPLLITAQVPGDPASSVRVDVHPDGTIRAVSALAVNTYLFLDSVQYPGA